MENVGCTTPFGINIDNICYDQNKSMQALKLFKSLLDTNLKMKECPYSCTIVKSLMKPGRPNENSNGKYVKFVFDKYIKCTKTRYSYTELELLAEIGGYVGLFLGLSVFDFRKLFDKILD